MSNSESRGIEDARFVRFTDDDGSEKCLQLIPLLMVIVFFPNLFLLFIQCNALVWSWI
jgi:hypothetical protein